MLIFHVAFPHQRKSVSSSASTCTDAEAQQGGNQCLFVEGLQQVHVHLTPVSSLYWEPWNG